MEFLLSSASYTERPHLSDVRHTTKLNIIRLEDATYQRQSIIDKIQDGAGCIVILITKEFEQKWPSLFNVSICSSCDKTTKMG